MRIEEDHMAPVSIPEDALWGDQTQRAVENFPLSGERFGRAFIKALGFVKWACTAANQELGKLDDERAGAILAACEEVIQGRWDEHFPVDVFQTGSGTSTNMNMNEVLANRANQLLSSKPGDHHPVHPNDHVNRSQSSNDTFPTAIHLAALASIKGEMIPALQELESSLLEKARSFHHVVKVGRTHLQDALPVRMDQVFGGYAAQVKKSLDRMNHAVQLLSVLPLGGTAVGTGANRPADFPQTALIYLEQRTGRKLTITSNHMEGNASRDDLVEVGGLLETVAVSMTKIANDIRWMASGPRAGLNELYLPKVQPGSSAMPGKHNPVIAEALIMISAQVIGNQTAVTQGGLGGYFELNLMMPLIAHNILKSIKWLAAAVKNFSRRCVVGIEVNQEHCQRLASRDLMTVTALVPVIGHDRAAKISRQAQATHQTIYEVALQEEILPEQELKEVLNLNRMTRPDS